jgi:hypothetical protein
LFYFPGSVVDQNCFEADPESDPNFDVDADPDPVPDCHQNNADPLADPTLSLTYVRNLNILKNFLV